MVRQCVVRQGPLRFDKAVKVSFGVVWCVKFGQLRRCMFC